LDVEVLELNTGFTTVCGIWGIGLYVLGEHGWVYGTYLGRFGAWGWIHFLFDTPSFRHGHVVRSLLRDNEDMYDNQNFQQLVLTDVPTDFSYLFTPSGKVPTTYLVYFQYAGQDA